METTVKHDSLAQLQSLELSQLTAIEGGLTMLTDVSGMPDRSEMCGTMWIMQRLLDRLFPGR